VLALTLLIAALATYRITRLLVADAWPPTEWFRMRVERRMGSESAWAYFVNCPWCVSAYIGGAVVAGLDLLTTHDVPVPGLLWLAFSAVTGWLANGEP
jgi:hypothetical protein